MRSIEDVVTRLVTGSYELSPRGAKRDEKCLDRYEWEGETFLCQLTPGHKGPHESGNWEWWAADGPVHTTKFVNEEPDKGFDEPTRD